MPKKVFLLQKDFLVAFVNNKVTVIGNSDGELMESYLCVITDITQVGFLVSLFFYA